MQHVWGKGEMQNVLWLGKLKEKRPPGRHRCRWKFNITTLFKGTGCESVE
jgi:hypothetical protein